MVSLDLGGCKLCVVLLDVETVDAMSVELNGCCLKMGEFDVVGIGLCWNEEERGRRREGDFGEGGRGRDMWPCLYTKSGGSAREHNQ